MEINSKNIVIATSFLLRENGSFNHLLKDLSESIINEGHRLTRLAAVESYNDKSYRLGIHNDDIKYKLFKKREVNKSNFVIRYLVDNIMSFRQAIYLLNLKNVDILLEEVSYSSFWRIIIAKLKKIRIITMVQDLWPDNSVQANIIKKNSIIYRFFNTIQNYIYKKSDVIVCISDDMKEFLIEKGVERDKIRVIYNWSYSDKINKIHWSDNKFVKKFNLNENIFYAIYAGNIGKMQNIDIILRAADRLKENNDIRFLIVGSGADIDKVEESAKSLDNVKIIPMQPQEFAPHIYSASDINLVPLVNGGIKTAFPSKTAVILSCGTPAIFMYGTDSKFSKAVSNNCLYKVIDNDVSSLVNSILYFKMNNSIYTRTDYGLFKSMFSRSDNLKKYMNIIDNLDK